VSTTNNISNQARFLRNASPQAYDKFCEEFRAYTLHLAQVLVTADTDLPLHQGRAQMCQKLLVAFEEAKNG
jgi:hypothetical protein